MSNLIHCLFQPRIGIVEASSMIEGNLQIHSLEDLKDSVKFIMEFPPESPVGGTCKKIQKEFKQVIIALRQGETPIAPSVSPSIFLTSEEMPKQTLRSFNKGDEIELLVDWLISQFAIEKKSEKGRT